MNPKLFLLLPCLAAAAMAPAARASVDLAISAEIRLGRMPPPPPPEVVVVEPVGPAEPPPWAKARWYRRSYAYYYYPGYDVYFRPADRVWFYLDRGTWRFAAQLPTAIRVDFGRAVALTLESDRPYTYHDRVRVYYPETYFTKVKFKHDSDRRPDRADAPPGQNGDRDDSPGRGKGRGKGKDK